MPTVFRRVSQFFNKSDSPPEPSPAGIPKNILAFRTITKLLSLIQQERAFQALQPRSEDNRRLELKLINALATVAVIEHEVVAVVTKHFSPQTPDTLEITACIQGYTPTIEQEFRNDRQLHRFQKVNFTYPRDQKLPF